MKTRTVKNGQIKNFELFLREEERSEATIKKYKHDVDCFKKYAKDAEIDKPLVMEYKKHLCENYATASANSMIAALNAFLRFLGWHELCVKQLRVQREAYCSEQKELSRDEYQRLVSAAKRQQNESLDLIIQTICSTGIRVSELSYITVEAVRQGEASVRCKGKNRRIFIVPELRKKLIRYAEKRKITSGSVFVSRSGAPISRNAVWRQMKGLCSDAGVRPEKVFPHNLRHLFARTFYSIEKDIAKLADILGHASINTTRIYIVSTGSEHKRKLENMRLII